MDVQTTTVTNVTATMFSITSLSAFTEYNITVYAGTSIGLGPGCSIMQMTSASGNSLQVWLVFVALAFLSTVSSSS